MRPIAYCLLCVFFAGALLIIAGCVQNQPDQMAPSVPAPVTPAAGAAAQEELVAFVDSAVAYAHTVGKERALAGFSDPNGSFVRGELYIYAYDFNGLTIAHPFNPEKIGINRLDEKDAQGTLFIKNLRDTAQNGSGFVTFYYINPAHNRTVEQKLGYVKKAGDDWWLGSGIYQPQGSAAGPSIPAPSMSRDELVKYVESAKSYALNTGKVQSLAEFNNRSGQFVSGDRYIFAYDYNGNTLALPYQPELLGTNRMAVEDAQGTRFIEGLAKTARGGSGFVDYLYADPARNFSVQKKTSYVVDVDGTWFLGSGMYS